MALQVQRESWGPCLCSGDSIQTPARGPITTTQWSEKLVLGYDRSTSTPCHSCRDDRRWWCQNCFPPSPRGPSCWPETWKGQGSPTEAAPQPAGEGCLHNNPYRLTSCFHLVWWKPHSSLSWYLVLYTYGPPILVALSSCPRESDSSLLSLTSALSLISTMAWPLLKEGDSNILHCCDGEETLFPPAACIPTTTRPLPTQ